METAAVQVITVAEVAVVEHEHGATTLQRCGRRRVAAGITPRRCLPADAYRATRGDECDDQQAFREARERASHPSTSLQYWNITMVSSSDDRKDPYSYSRDARMA